MAQYNGMEIVTVMCGYQGPKVYIGEKYDFNEVSIDFYYSDAPGIKEHADINEYMFHDTDNTVYSEGNNIYMVTWNGMDFMYIVKGTGINCLSAIYKGPWVYAGCQYDMHDISVKLAYKDGHTVQIPWDKCMFRHDTTLNSQGMHVHSVYFDDINGKTWTAQYMVECITITSLYASYHGFPILLNDKYNIQDVLVTAEISNGIHETILPSQCTFSNATVKHTGSVQETVSYTDAGGREWTASFTVEGLKRPVVLKAEYTGIKKTIGSVISKNEIYAVLVYDDGTVLQDCALGNDEWEWKSVNSVLPDNKGVLEITWEHDYGYRKLALSATVKIPYADYSSCSLVAWYEGLPVETGHVYNKEHVVIYLHSDGCDAIRLSYEMHGVDISGSVVTHEGSNWFTASYVYGRYVLKTKFPVQGVIYKTYPDVDFKVVYINKSGLQETDVTEDFRPYFNLFGIFNINWTQFLRAVSGTGHYGMYRVDAPKNTGLFNKYASVWHVLCSDSHTLKACIFKVYDEPGKGGCDMAAKKKTVQEVKQNDNIETVTVRRVTASTDVPLRNFPAAGTKYISGTMPAHKEFIIEKEVTSMYGTFYLLNNGKYILKDKCLTVY